MVDEGYYNISREEVNSFCDTCETCSKKVNKINHHDGAKRAIKSHHFRSRYLPDLVDHREAAQLNAHGVVMRWMLVVKYHFTRFVILWPIPCKEASM